MRTPITTKLTVLDTIPQGIKPETRKAIADLLTKDGDHEVEQYAALALGTTALASMEALVALKVGRMEPIGQDPKLVSPIKPASAKQYIKRADGQVVKFTLGLSVSHKLASAGETPDVI